MTDSDQGSDAKGVTEPPADEGAPSLENDTAPIDTPAATEEATAESEAEVGGDLAASAEESTAESPAAIAPADSAAAVPASDGVQQTAVMPQVPPPLAVTVSATQPVVTEAADTEGDTAESTLGDEAATGSEGNRLTLWLAGLKAKLTRGGKKEPDTAKSDPAKTGRWRRVRPWQWALIGAGALVLLFAIFVAVDAGLYYNKVHHGVSVVDQDLSRMDTDEATQTLTALVDEVQQQPITLSNGEQTWTVLPGDLGTEIDVDTAVSNAMAVTRDGNVITDLGKKIALYFSAEDLPLNGTVDDSKIDELLTTIATELDVPAVNATLKVVDGDIQIVEAQEGEVVDTQALRASLTDLLLTLHSTELPIPMVADSPELEAVDIEDALAQAKVMIGSDLVVTYQGKTLATLTPAELVTYVAVAPPAADGQDATTVPIFSPEKMTAFFDTIEPQVSTPAKDATFEMDLEGEEPYPLVVVEGVDGEGLDREATAAAITEAAAGTTGRTAEVALKPVEPERTTEDLQAMGIKDLLGDYRTSPYVGTKNRQTNVRLATKLCSGVFLAPGEEFNTDERLGKRNAANGWATAPGIVGPGQLEDVYGGGICQVSTTLWNAVLLSGLEITERHNHSIFINHYPDGRDATVTAGGKNMRFRNDTDHYIFIYGWSTGINTRFWIWGVDDGREVKPIKFSGFSFGERYTTETYTNTSLPVGTTKEIFSGQSARSCSVERTIVYADGTTKTEKFSSKYPMMPKVLETNPKPAPTTTAAPPATAAPPTTAAP